jgi:hypothetical protein
MRDAFRPKDNTAFTHTHIYTNMYSFTQKNEKWGDGGGDGEDGGAPEND